ncbi:translation initiation factor IF-2-like, partial [Peromyscus californicus insignis]|uniref:translation initiation factor IF-2-like n=1 Tax=Peromyscus californicus insignis TaxID=564181 RepID=UPI0022A673E1
GGPSSSGSSFWSSGSSSWSPGSSRPSSEPRPAGPRADFEKFGRRPRPRGSAHSRGSAGLRAAAWGRRPRPARRIRAPWAALRGVPPARGGDAASADTKAPGLPRPLGGRGAAPRPPRPACAPQPSTGPGFGGGDPGRAEPRTRTRTRTELRGRGLAGRQRCAPGPCAPGPALTPSPYAPGSPRPPRPITPGSTSPVRAPQLGLHVLRCPPRPKTPWLRAPYEGRKGAASCSALPGALQGPKPSNSASRSSAPRAALCPSGPETPSSTPLCTPSPAPDSPRKQQLATSSQPQQAS